MDLEPELADAPEAVTEPFAEPAAVPPPIPPPIPASLPRPEPVAIPPKPFPGLAQSLGVMALLLLVQGLLAGLVVGIDQVTGQHWIGKAGILGVINLFSFGVIGIWLGRRMGTPVTTVLATPPPRGTFSLANVLTLCWAVAGQLLFAVGFIYAVGGKGIEKSEYVERLNEVMDPGQPWWIIVLVLVVVAPLTEELLFRGQFLRGFLARYATPVAVGASAVLFSLMHLNPVQIPATLMLGILSGVLYERTRSVWPSIFVHMLNNSVPAFAALGAGRAKAAGTKDFDPTLGSMLALIAVGLVLWIVAVAMLRRTLPGRDPRTTPSTTVSPTTAAECAP